MLSKTRFLYLMFFLLCVGLLAVGIHSALRGNPLGADFYIYWRAARAEFSEGRSAYDPAVTRDIQMGIQGQLSQPDGDQLAYSYPIFGLWIVAPFSFLPFDWAQAIWMAAGFVLVLLAGLLLSPQKRRWIGATLWLIYPISFALIMGNFNLLVALIWIFFFARILLPKQDSTDDSFWLGLLLAVTTLKPQFSWLFLVFSFLFVLKQKAWRLAGGFVTGCVLLWLGPFLWRPNWLAGWISQFPDYMVGNGGRSSTFEHLLSLLPAGFVQPVRWVCWICLAGITLYLFVQAWRGRLPALNLIAWCGVLAFLVHPTGMSYEQMTFLIPLFFWAVSERRPLLSALVWSGFVLLSWLALMATLTKFDPLAASSWLLAAALGWLAWLFARSRGMRSLEYNSHAVNLAKRIDE